MLRTRRLGRDHGLGGRIGHRLLAHHHLHGGLVVARLDREDGLLRLHQQVRHTAVEPGEVLDGTLECGLVDDTRLQRGHAGDHAVQTSQSHELRRVGHLQGGPRGGQRNLAAGQLDVHALSALTARLEHRHDVGDDITTLLADRTQRTVALRLERLDAFGELCVRSCLSRVQLAHAGNSTRQQHVPVVLLLPLCSSAHCELLR